MPEVAEGLDADALADADARADLVRTRALHHRLFRRWNGPRTPPTPAELDAAAVAAARRSAEWSAEQAERARIEAWQRPHLERAMDDTVTGLRAAAAARPACAPEEAWAMAAKLLEWWEPIVAGHDAQLIADMLPLLDEATAGLRTAEACAPGPPVALAALDEAMARVRSNLLPSARPAGTCGNCQMIAPEPPRSAAPAPATAAAPRPVPPPPADAAAMEPWLAEWRAALPAGPPQALNAADIDAYVRHGAALEAAFATLEQAAAGARASRSSSAAIALAALHVRHAEHLALLLAAPLPGEAARAGDGVPAAEDPDHAWIRWALADRRVRVTFEMLRAFDRADALLAPFLALGGPRRPAALRARAIAVQEESVTLAEQVFPIVW